VTRGALGDDTFTLFSRRLFLDDTLLLDWALLRGKTREALQMTQCSTFSKHPNCYPSYFPREIESGYGAQVIDSRGWSYIDWTWSGTGILGHAPQEVSRAVSDTMFKGCAFGLPHALERQTADLMLELLPDYAERVMFELNGTDVVAGAVRLARAVTGSPWVITFKDAYHGASAEWFLVSQPPARGIPEHWLDESENTTVESPCTWNDADSIREFTQYPYKPAAVIFEVRTPPTPEFVDALNNLPPDVVLIADEVVTGFRLAKGGACELYGIKPDLACFGKALGSGVPISALVGKEKYMREFDLDYTNEPVFMSYTHGGNALGLAAAKKTLEIIRDTEAIEKIYWIGSELQDAFWELAALRNISVSINNQPPRHSFLFHDFSPAAVPNRELFTLFQQKMCEQGVLIGPTNCPTIAHEGEPLEKTKEAMKTTLESVSRAIEKGTVEGELKGPVPMPLYSGKV